MRHLNIFSPGRFLAERRSVAALEFALILPVMLVLVAGVYDITEALIVYNTINDTANNVVETGTILALKDHTDNSTALSYDQVQLAESTIWADFPDLRSGQKSGNTSVTLTSIDYQPGNGCLTGSYCALYVAYVVWSETYAGGTSGRTFKKYLRPCSQLNNAANPGTEVQVPYTTALGLPGKPNDFTYTLPTLGVATYANDETGPSPILVADVTFTYTPLFNFYIKSNITFLATALWPVRSVKNLSTVMNGSQKILPLAQEFTTILGGVSGSTLTLYTQNGAVDSAEPTVPYVGGQGLSGSGNSGDGTFCINTFYSSPYPTPYSAPTPQS